MLSQEGICFAKMTTAEKTSVSGKRRGVRRFEDDMFLCINERFLFLSVTSPEEEDKEITFFWKGMNDRVSKCLPSLPSMWHRLSSADGECRIQEENTLLSPTWEITIFWTRNAEISLNFLKYIHEWWRISHSFLYRERETMSLPRTMIWILAEYDDFYFLKGCIIECCKYVFRVRVYCLTCNNLVFYKLREFSEIRFFEFFWEHFFPAFLDFYFSHSFSLGSREWRYSSIKLWINREVLIGSGICVILKSEISLAESLAVLIMRFP